MVTWIIVFSFFGALGLSIILILPSKIRITSSSIEIGRVLPVVIPFAEIQVLNLKNKYPKTIRKISGFDSGDVKKGVFEISEKNQVRLNIYQDYPPFIELIYRNGIFVFNTRDAEKTKELYDDLEKRV